MSGRKRHRVKKEPEIRPYQPDWAILSDYILATGAPEPAKNLGPDLCHSFILPVDRLVYASKPPIAACKELIGHLSLVCSFPLSLFSTHLLILTHYFISWQAVPCAASVLEKVEDMSRDIASIQDLQTRADKAKPVLEGFNTQVRDQKDRIEKMEKQVKDVAEGETDHKDRVRRRMDALRAARKDLKKTRKLLLKAEDRGVDTGYDAAVFKAHEVVLDHRFLLDPGMPDPVGRPEEEDVPPCASSDPDFEYSE